MQQPETSDALPLFGVGRWCLNHPLHPVSENLVGGERKGESGIQFTKALAWVRVKTCISLLGEVWLRAMREFMSITKALADENRIRTLLALRQGELCVCQITELFGLAPSTISKHLSILFQAGLVESRKDGRWFYYQLPG